MSADPFLFDLLTILLHERVDLQRRVAELEARLRQEVDYLRGEIKGDRNLRTLTGDSAAMKQVRQAIGQVAATDSTVLVLGETGTGKELVARAIHQLSPRRDHLLVSLNCAALSPTLLASELFGHEAGAFTGASKRRLGRFELAHRGTLFLDEIGELPAEVQVLLLRVLQERTIERVGGNQPIALDVRVVAATHQDLAALVQAGRFRADLFYRLNVFPIHVPTLRERPEDVADLARHFVHQFNRRMNKRVQHIHPKSLRLMQAYPWPGNVRELENIVERAMIGAAGETLEIDPRWLAVPAPAASAAFGFQDIERQTIEAALARCRGRIYGPGGAAAALQLRPTTLYSKMRKLGISKHPSDGPPSQ
jgi:formate hydrogenlyase transcriptional activator